MGIASGAKKRNKITRTEQPLTTAGVQSAWPYLYASTMTEGWSDGWMVVRKKSQEAGTLLGD